MVGVVELVDVVEVDVALKIARVFFRGQYGDIYRASGLLSVVDEKDGRDSRRAREERDGHDAKEHRENLNVERATLLSHLVSQVVDYNAASRKAFIGAFRLV